MFTPPPSFHLTESARPPAIAGCRHYFTFRGQECRLFQDIFAIFIIQTPGAIFAFQRCFQAAGALLLMSMPPMMPAEVFAAIMMVFACQMLP